MTVISTKRISVIGFLLLILFQFFWFAINKSSNTTKIKLIDYKEKKAITEVEINESDLKNLDSNVELRNMIKYMFRVGAFMADINYLNDTSVSEDEKLSKNFMDGFFERDKYIAFGMIAKNLDIFGDEVIL